MRKLKKVAVAVSGALLMGYGMAAKADITPFTPSAYAESILNVSNFAITDGAGGSLLPLLGVSILNLQASVQGTVSANLNGGPGFTNGAIINPLQVAPVPSFNLTASEGPGYIPFTSYAVGTLAPTTFAGAAAQHSGNALQLNGQPTTTANTQAQVNINQSASFGSADARQNLATTFNLVVATTQAFRVTFNADTFARIALGQEDVIAQIDREWALTVTNTTNPLSPVTLLGWAPDGVLGNLTGACTLIVGACTELSDPFSLNIQAAFQTTGDVDQANSGLFSVFVVLTPGSYQLAINHDTSADAAAIPEPGSLALLGAALLGLVGLRRKAKKA